MTTRLLALRLAVMVLTISSSARAQDTSDLRGLLDEPVISTASNVAEMGSTAPATSSTITARELRTYGIQSLDEALNFLSLGMLAENQLSVPELGARGVLFHSDYGNHVLVMINGIFFND